MMYETIHNHAQIQALHARFGEQPLQASSGQNMLVKLVSVETVRIAPESYELLCPLVVSRSWICRDLDLLSVAAGMALELHKLEHDLLPQLMVEELELDGGVLKALVLVKSSAMALLHMGKDLGGLIDEAVEKLNMALQDTAACVLRPTRDIVWLRKVRVPCVLQMVTALLVTPVRFSVPVLNPDRDSDSE